MSNRNNNLLSNNDAKTSPTNSNITTVNLSNTSDTLDIAQDMENLRMLSDDNPSVDENKQQHYDRDMRYYYYDREYDDDYLDPSRNEDDDGGLEHMRKHWDTTTDD